jgi:hypothetical protein
MKVWEEAAIMTNKNGTLLGQKSVGELITSGYTTIKLLSLSKHPPDIFPPLSGVRGVE